VKKIRSMVERFKVVTAFRMPFKSYRGGRYRVLGTPPDGAFDRIAALAAHAFQVPIAIVNLGGSRSHLVQIPPWS
jgi:hypothetical protein